MLQVNGCLSYSEKVPDGFYVVHGMDPYVWSMCMDQQENGRVPSLESLKALDPCSDSSIGAVLIDRRGDPGLKELQNAVFRISQSCITTEAVVKQLAKLVFNHMGLVYQSYRWGSCLINFLVSKCFINKMISMLFFWGLKGFSI